MTEKRARLSIVIPCYQAEPYLRRCLDALLGQSLPGIELVCVNDCSPDGSLSILYEYQRRYGSRIVIIDKKKNEGVWKARKDGIQTASGRYIGFADPDDYVKPGFARKLYRAAVQSGADIACCGYERIDMASGKVLSREMTRFRYRSFDLRKDPGLMLEVNSALWNKIFRAEMIKDMPAIRDMPAVLDDLTLALLIYPRVRRVAIVNEPLICYMVRQGSIIHSMKAESAAGVYRAAKELRDVYEHVNPDLLDYLEAAVFLHAGIALMYRLSEQPDFAGLLRDNRAFLNREFPGWKTNPYISPGYVLRHRGRNAKVLTVHVFYRLRLFRIFIGLYRLITEGLKTDIKW